MGGRIRSCFISAAPGTNLRALRKELKRREIQVTMPDEIALGSSWPLKVSRIIAEVDLVIGVLTRERRSNWVLFDLGQAWANDRQVLLITPPKGVDIPPGLQRFLTVRSGLLNREAIGFALDQLLAAPERSIDIETTFPILQGLGGRSDFFLEAAHQAIHDGQHRALESLVATALRETGVDVLSTDETYRRGADLAIWADALQPFVGNPLLVEIKMRLRGKVDRKKAVHKLAEQLSDSGTKWGLLLYGKGPEPVGSQARLSRNVLILSLDSLFEQMRHRPFADVVRDLRNRRVHGIPT